MFVSKNVLSYALAGIGALVGLVAALLAAFELIAADDAWEE